MAAVVVSPVFVRDLPTLKASLRLSSVADDNDADSIISDAVRAARSDLQRRLGITRVASLAAIVYDPEAAAPATADELLRETANLTEIAMCRRTLLRRLPTLFRDASGDAALSWQQDALTRERNADTKRELDELDRQIEENLTLLEGGDDQEKIKATSFEPEDSRSMGSSIFGTGGLGGLNG